MSFDTLKQEMDINTLRNQNHYNSLCTLNDMSELLYKYYYEQEYNCRPYTYSWLADFLDSENCFWIRNIWSTRNLYYYRILDKNRKEVFCGSFIDIIRKLKAEPNKEPRCTLILTAFKEKEPEPEVVPELTDSEKIKKLETDISEIKELLKKMVV